MENSNKHNDTFSELEEQQRRSKNNSYQNEAIEQIEYKDNIETIDYRDTFTEEENKNSNLSDNINLNMNSANESDVATDSRNSTIKKIQFYITMIGGSILIILILFSVIRKMTSSSDDEDKNKVVKEIEAPKVQELKKDNFFSKDKDNETIKDNPFEKTNISDSKNENIFSTIPTLNPPKPKIVKGSVGALVSTSSGGKSTNYDNQIAELEAEKEKLLNSEDTKAGSADFDGDTYSPTVAKINEFNPDLLLPKGSYIGCSLDTRFVSAIQGSTSCTVSQNIYSSNGNVLLIEKGSKLFGTYRGDNANDGTSRYFVVWQEVRTPKHLRIPLNSGSSDELGGAGLEGEIDHKWMMRFGSSIMLSAIDDMWNVLAYNLTNKNNSSNNIDYTENSRENAKNISSIALEKFINIKPTVYKQHGDLVGVYVNRDVDFSKVYKITKKK